MTMTADCEQTRARLLELLYGELAPEARAEVEGHVAGCAGCKAELAALQSTRSLVRGRLTTDAPPARARAAILQAAAAAVPARAAAQAPKMVQKPVGPSFWTRIRAKWTLPTFATVGAVAVFLLASRIFMEPEKTYQRGRQGLAPASTEAPVEPPAPTPAAAADDRKAEAEAEAKASRAANLEPKEALAADAERASSALAGVRHKAPPPKGAGLGGRPQAKKVESAARAPRADQPLDGLIGAPAAAQRRPAKAAFQDDLLEGFADQAPSKQKSGAGGGALRGRSEGEEDKPAPAPARTAAAPAPAPPPPTAAAMDQEDEPRARVRETAEQRADRLFAQHRWVEAAQAYRELLRDQSRSPNVGRWRQRLADCNAALLDQR